MKSYQELIRHSGNQDLFRAVEMSVAALMSGVPFHIHAEGLRGTGKTSIMRAAKQILPQILRIKGCIYNCHPHYPHCPQHSQLSTEQIAEIGFEKVPCPFLEISHAAKIGTIAGSIDLSQLTNRMNPKAALLPGTIPQAHRGIIFIDEINRLADTSPELADVLLAVMGTKPGRIQIEESGLPVVDIPVSVSVWAASNPDEEPGGLTQVRRQLADRFDMVVSMGRPNDYQSVSMILNKQTLLTDYSSALQKCSGLNLQEIECGDKIRSTLASIYVDFGLESLRAIEAVDTGARLSALLSGREKVCNTDLLAVVPTVLSHRTDSGTITSILKYLESLENTATNYTSPVERGYSSTSLPPDITASGSDVQTENWFRKLWNQLRSLMRPAKAEQPRTDNNQQLTNREATPQNKAGSMSGGPQSSPADPLKTNINAPAKTAMPLANLKVEEYVSDGDNQNHGR